MNSTLCRVMAKMMIDGFRPYGGEIDAGVYAKLGCKDSSRAYWLHRWPILHCLGCKKRCTPKSTNGFQVPMKFPAVQERGKFSLLPEEMLRTKKLLRVDEAAYCLSLSEATVRRLVDEGVLVRHVRLPIRITAESVQEEMERVDW
ncbi:helix-turn-helix domain-containing protein [Halodesulfovibrio aestuarii]|uniref:Helix-turn-helix domain-containing protein n=1 Tax=Halodesulfovibrio aestuarii TaxID=126333 RepID=A0A8G2F7Y7_9BACT|nr:helix-turn-helix domain-containing protein [Halodesulfovibrio aestuarii]SHI60311.1 hypothetical protein SAMN05660830_00430 [Halodesulfovibrio aestuarii]